MSGRSNSFDFAVRNFKYSLVFLFCCMIFVVELP